MSEPTPLRPEDLTAPEAQRVDRTCDRYEAAWKAAATSGQQPRIEDFLGETPEPEHSVLLPELVALDVHYRRLAGETPQADDYQHRFSQFEPFSFLPLSRTGPSPEPATQAVFARAASPRPPLAPHVVRIRCPHCHNPIQLVDERPDEVLCPGCGSSFRVCEAHHTSTTVGMRPLDTFQLLDLVGLGAFGAVWRARDTELDRIVALEIPHASLLSSETELERFHREARAAAQLRHPGIVTVHEVQTLEGRRCKPPPWSTKPTSGW
jgi:hypothetical protein